MNIEKRYQVWQVAANDKARPVLAGICVARRPDGRTEATAADGFLLATVPVELAPDDVLPNHDDTLGDYAIVPAAAFKEAAKSAGRLDRAFFALTADGARVWTKDGGQAVYPYIDATYPDYSAIRPVYARGEYPADKYMTLNAGYLARLGAALGDPNTGVALEMRGPTSPIVVYPADKRTNTAVGIIMPMHVRE